MLINAFLCVRVSAYSTRHGAYGVCTPYITSEKGRGYVRKRLLRNGEGGGSLKAHLVLL